MGLVPPPQRRDNSRPGQPPRHPKLSHLPGPCRDTRRKLEREVRTSPGELQLGMRDTLTVPGMRFPGFFHARKLSPVERAGGPVQLALLPGRQPSSDAPGIQPVSDCQPDVVS